jgi:prepilin-type N-terminal cleavage/methylation domain-containing protein
MRSRKGLTLIELLVVVIILGALVAIAVPRMSASSTTAKQRACKANQSMINTQVELYYLNNDSWPTLSTIVDDPNYFPDGEPNCPSGGTYTLDGSTHHVSCSVSGH